LVGCREGFQAIAAVTDAQVAELAMGDAALLVQVDGQTVCRLTYGEYTPSSPMFIASAAKWLSLDTVGSRWLMMRRYGELHRAPVPRQAGGGHACKR